MSCSCCTNASGGCPCSSTDPNVSSCVYKIPSQTQNKPQVCSSVNPSPNQLMNSFPHYFQTASHGTSQHTFALGIARAAFLKGVEWPQGYTIKVGFIKTPDSGYDDSKAKWVQECIEKNIKPLVNLSYKWDVDLNSADIRISFVPDLGAWSAVGTQSKSQTDKSAATMNLGWLDRPGDQNTTGVGTVVVHEFGHSLGMIHEHSRGDAALKWNKSVVYGWCGCQPNCWTKDIVDSNIFEVYNTDSFNGSEYDKNSIMHYWFPPQFFDPPVNLPRASVLSDLDKQWISKTYPPGAVSSSLMSIQSSVKNNWFLWLVIALLVGVIVYLVKGRGGSRRGI